MKIEKKRSLSRLFHIGITTLHDEILPLDGIGIETCSNVIEKNLLDQGFERRSRIRIRFSLEESLLRLRNRFGEEQTFRLKIENRFGTMQIQLEVEGDVYNPLSKTEVEIEDWSGALLTAVGLSPLYNYSKGKNILSLRLPHKGINAALKMIIAVLFGLIVGILINTFLPDTIQDPLIQAFLTPLYDFWIRLLTLCSGPVVFLMVCSSVLNSGIIEEEGGSTKKFITRYFLLSLLAAIIAVLASIWYSTKPILFGTTLGIDAREYFDAILSIVPADIITPLQQSNTPQLLLMAFTIGSVIMASRADGLKKLVHQGNIVGLQITEIVSHLVPWFAALLICKEIVQDMMLTFWGIWIILGASILVSSVLILGVAFYVKHSKKLSLKILLKKLWPSFSLVLRTGSIDEGYSEMESICSHKLGIERHFTEVSLPQGLVLYMPVNVIGTLMFTIYAAVKFDVDLSLGWLFIAMVLSVVLFVATPPVPGANLLAYIMIFAQLEIPSVALIDAMIFDILFGIFASAANQLLLQMELILQADSIGLLNLKVLRKR